MATDTKTEPTYEHLAAENALLRAFHGHMCSLLSAQAGLEAALPSNVVVEAKLIADATMGDVRHTMNWWHLYVPDAIRAARLKAPSAAGTEEIFLLRSA
jgi:hypothetical protein